VLNLEVHANVLKYCLAKRKPNVNIIIIYVNYNNYGLYGFSHKGFGQMSQLSEPLDSGWIRPKHFDDHSWNGCAHTHTHTHPPTHMTMILVGEMECVQYITIIRCQSRLFT